MPVERGARKSLLVCAAKLEFVLCRFSPPIKHIMRARYFHDFIHNAMIPRGFKTTITNAKKKVIDFMQSQPPADVARRSLFHFSFITAFSLLRLDELANVYLFLQTPYHFKRKTFPTNFCQTKYLQSENELNRFLFLSFFSYRFVFHPHQSAQIEYWIQICWYVFFGFSVESKWTLKNDKIQFIGVRSSD